MLKALSAYSESEISQIRRHSPAFDLYWPFTQISSTDDFQRLRKERHISWCECALATYFKTAVASEVCLQWSETADSIMLQAWQIAGLDTESAALFALGKLGSKELNLSSDVDLMIVANPESVSSVEKKLRTFRQLLHHRTEWAACFRLDFDLRPGGTMGPLIVTPSQFQDYYWSQGEAWERLALVRLRALTGPRDLSDSIVDLSTRFSFRKFLDYSLLEDFKALRAQIHQSGFARESDQTHLKLEVGGIRDIELFLHSLLVLNGGKIPELQTRSTQLAADRLAHHKILPQAEADFLANTYWEYRQYENQIQAYQDQQTHNIPWTSLPEGWNWPFVQDLKQKMRKTDQIVSSLLGRVDLSKPQLPSTIEDQESWLKKLGFTDDAIREAWPKLIKATVLSYKNDRDERARRQFLFSFIEKMSSLGHDQNLGLHVLCDFVKATRAKATFFSLLLREPLLLADLARMFCLSPYLGAILSARPELLDSFILHRDETWSKDIELLLNQTSARKLLVELRASNIFLQDLNLNSLLTHTSQTADEICSALLDSVKAEVGSNDLEILALGKWGGSELGLRSDLDFIFFTKDKPLDVDFKAARRFISRLSDPQKGGTLYGVDLRLRPSGQSGAILSSLPQLETYWRETAEPWERQAYTRLRPLNSRFNLDTSLFLKRGLSAADLLQLKTIREKLLKPLGENSLDLKYTSGCMVEIEFAIQTIVLKDQIVSPPATLEMLSRTPLSSTDQTILRNAYLFYRTLEQLLQLSAAHAITEVQFDSEIFAHACRLWKKDPISVRETLEHVRERVCEVLGRCDPTKLSIS